MIFLGSGDCSLKQREILLGRVQDALDHLGGAQQNGLQGSEFDEASDKQATQFIENVVRDVAMALTGKEILFEEPK